MTGSERRISDAGVSHDRKTPPISGTIGLSAEPSTASRGVQLYDTDRAWTLPNVLSFLRLAGVPHRAVADPGPAGRWTGRPRSRAWRDHRLVGRLPGAGRHQTSRIGQMLDPIADRLYILAVLIGLALREIVPWWLVVIVVGRDLFIALLIPVLKTRGYSSLPVHFVGKVATFSLLYAFPLVLLGSGEEGWLQLAWVVGWAFAIWGTALYWYAGGLYLVQTVRLLRSTPPIHGRGRSSVTR